MRSACAGGLFLAMIVSGCGGGSEPGRGGTRVQGDGDDARPGATAPVDEPTAFVDGGASALQSSALDLLLIMDNSITMAAEQRNLSAQLPRLLKALTTGDRTPELPPGSRSDTSRYFTPVTSLHLGVITTELAVMQGPVRGSLEECLREYTDANGRVVANDDGRLRSSVEIAVQGETSTLRNPPEGIRVGEVLSEPNPACAGKQPELDYLEYVTADESAEEALERAEEAALALGCLATVGGLGCAWEQQLEATWKALAPSDGEHGFLDGASGNGAPEGPNAGFLRRDAILAMIMVSDEDDCSITEAGRVLVDTPFRSGSEENEWSGVPYNVRCGAAAQRPRTDLLHDVKRYVEGFKSLKPGNPDRVILAGLVGIPEEAETLLQLGRHDDVLNLPDMRVRTLSADDLLPQPSCSVVRSFGGPREFAYPARRFVQAARDFGPAASLFSICRQSYDPVVDFVVEHVALHTRG